MEICGGWEGKSIPHPHHTGKEDHGHSPREYSWGQPGNERLNSVHSKIPGRNMWGGELIHHWNWTAPVVTPRPLKGNQTVLKARGSVQFLPLRLKGKAGDLKGELSSWKRFLFALLLYPQHQKCWGKFFQVILEAAKPPWSAASTLELQKAAWVWQFSVS